MDQSTIEDVTPSQGGDERTEVTIADQTVPVLGRNQLIANKRAVGRTRDLADLEDLERT